MKEIKEDIHKWRDLLCSITGIFNTIKMLILSKQTYMFNTTPLKIPADFKIHTLIGYSKMYMEEQKN